ncbi:FxSxx-COOH system tetratricopeptide repeat protein [Nonomuraea indica]|uniref:FxSxx-COOH system tetratricopeptide repeat protein n=1 Tax=Nonomuraea indica TaxID=1581193 RepID=A0ABW7ZWN7_9ACTN
MGAGGIFGDVITGDIYQFHEGALRGPAQVELPVPLNNLADAPSPVFLGRAEAMGQLNAEISAHSARVVIRGMGGVGKTELVRQYIATNRDLYQLIWWITAEGRGEVESGLTALAMRLHPPVGLVKSQEQSANWGRDWLQAHSGWLLILDNVEDPDDISDLLGQLHTGRILITTRRTVSWPARVRLIPLDILNPLAAAEMIAITSDGKLPPEHPDVASIAAELGYLPLALEQAAAYMRESKIGPGNYLALLRQHPSHMYNASFEGGNAERTIARLWRAHLGTLCRRNPYAVFLLQVLACYAPDDVPRSILGTEANKLDVIDALRLLASYTLITLGDETVSMHRLIHAVVRCQANSQDALPGSSNWGSPGETALVWAANAWTASESMPNSLRASIRRSLSPHAESLIDQCARSDMQHLCEHFFSDVGLYEFHQGSYHRSYRLLTHSISISMANLGEEDSHTLALRNNLANVMRAMGRLEEAVAQTRETLEISRRVLGENDLQTLTTRNNLAHVLWALGRLHEAEAEARTVLDARWRVLGAEALDTLFSRNILALTLGDLGLLPEAESEHRAVLEICCRNWGEEHPFALTSRNNLAIVLADMGRLEEAEAEHRTVLELRRQNWGEEHPSTLTSRNNLAGVLRDLGRLEEAEAEHRAELEICRRVLGEEHPDTLTSRNNLAGVLRDLGRLEEAEAEHRAELEICRRVLGEEHPDTLTSRKNLALVLHDLGRLEEAEAEGREVMEARGRVLSQEHPDTLTSRYNLALVLHDLGRREEAEAELRKVLEARLRLFGEDHPDTVNCREKLMIVLRELQRRSGGEGGGS